MLVNDIWGAELLHGGPPNWDRPIWEVDLDDGLRMLRLGIDTHLITSHHLLPLLVDRPGGLVVEVTDGTAAYNAEHYRISVFYDLVKVAVNRLAWSQGHELAPLGVHRGGGHTGVDALGDDAGALRRRPRRTGARRRGAARLRPVGDAALRRPGRRRPGGRPGPGALEPAVGDSRGACRAYGFTDVDGTQPDAWSVS